MLRFFFFSKNNSTSRITRNSLYSSLRALLQEQYTWRGIKDWTKIAKGDTFVIGDVLNTYPGSNNIVNQKTNYDNFENIYFKRYSFVSLSTLTFILVFFFCHKNFSINTSDDWTFHFFFFPHSLSPTRCMTLSLSIL